MKKMLYLASSYGHILSFHIPYIRKLHEMGFEVHVAAAGAFDSAELKKVKKINIPFEKSILSFKNIGCTFQLMKLMKKERYDIISVHTSLAAFYVRIAVMLIRGTKPKVINTVHGYLFDRDTSVLKRSILLWAEKLTRPATDILVVMNQQDYEIAEKHHLYKDKLIKIPGFGIDTERFSRRKVEEAILRNRINNCNKNVIATGIETDDTEELRRTERLKLGIKEKDIVLIYAAEFSKRKNHKMLIEAMTKLPENVKLLLAGKGELLEDCQMLSEHLNLRDTGETQPQNTNRVIFLGHVKNLEEYYYLSDICVSASRIEGLPFNIMEAMSMGIPVVATNVKGHQDLVEQGVNGYLYEFDDQRGCVEAVTQLINEVKAVNENNRVKAQNYRLELVMKEVLTVYERL